MAKAQLLRQVTEIRMIPFEVNGKKGYVAEGEWDFLAQEQRSSTCLGKEDQYVPMVAGERNVPKVRFSIKMI